MTRLAKVLVIFVAAASLCFAAFAAAMSTGGPNWVAMAAHPTISDKISIVPAGEKKYSASARVPKNPNEASVAQNVILADAVVKSQARILADMRNELQEVQGRLSTLAPQRDSAKSLSVTDRKGLEQHAELWAEQLKALTARINQTTDELAQTGVNAQQLQEQLRELRFEVLRLRNQLELLRDDSFWAQTQKESLEAELLLLQQNRLRLERRQQQLKEQVAGGYEQPGTAAQ